MMNTFKEHLVEDRTEQRRADVDEVRKFLGDITEEHANDFDNYEDFKQLVLKYAPELEEKPGGVVVSSSDTGPVHVDLKWLYNKHNTVEQERFTTSGSMDRRLMKLQQIVEVGDYRNLTCPNCKGVGHFADDEDLMDDDDYCTMCAGHGELALKGKDCIECGGTGHFVFVNGEISDDEYCYDCAGTGQVGNKGQPVYNSELHGQVDIKPPPGR